MRKLFFSMMFGQDLVQNEYKSEDFDLGDKQFLFPLTYIIKNNAQEGEEIEIITVVEEGNAERHKSRDNYEMFKEEVQAVLAENKATANFREIYIGTTFDVKASKRYFKEIVDSVKEGDTIFADVTFGIKIFTISMFVALNYVAQGTKDVDVDTIIYAWKYNSTIKAQDAKESIIYDVTSLFYLNAIAGQISDGERAIADKLFN